MKQIEYYNENSTLHIYRYSWSSRVCGWTQSGPVWKSGGLGTNSLIATQYHIMVYYVTFYHFTLLNDIGEDGRFCSQHSFRIGRRDFWGWREPLPRSETTLVHSKISFKENPSAHNGWRHICCRSTDRWTHSKGDLTCYTCIESHFDIWLYSLLLYSEFVRTQEHSNERCRKYWSYFSIPFRLVGATRKCDDAWHYCSYNSPSLRDYHRFRQVVYSLKATISYLVFTMWI